MLLHARRRVCCWALCLLLVVEFGVGASENPSSEGSHKDIWKVDFGQHISSEDSRKDIWKIDFALKILGSFHFESLSLSIWEDKVTSDFAKTYYVTPLVRFLPGYTKCRTSQLTQSHVVSYAIEFWNEPVSKAAIVRLGELGLANLTSNQIQPMPFYQVRVQLNSLEAMSGIQLNSAWNPSLKQPDVHRFTLLAESKERCLEVAESMRTDPTEFAGSVVLEYVLSSESLSSRTISAKAEQLFRLKQQHGLESRGLLTVTVGDDENVPLQTIGAELQRISGKCEKATDALSARLDELEVKLAQMKHGNGSWSAWSSWGYCTVSCGGGTQMRTRSQICTDTNGIQVGCGAGAASQSVSQACHNFDCNCQTVTGRSCIFPWTYNVTGSIVYPACSTVHDKGDWCPTGVSRTGTYISGSGKWGHCSPNCPKCLTVDGPVVGADCRLPFTLNGTSHNGCTTADNTANNGLAWCATGSSVSTQWGICDDSRLCPNGN